MRSKTQSTWHEIVYLKEHQLLRVRLIKAREKHSDEAVLHSVGLNQSTLLMLRLTAYYVQQRVLCKTRTRVLKAVDDDDDVEDNGRSVGHNEQ